MNVFIYQQNQQSGPFSAEAFQGMLQMGSVANDASVWLEGSPDWVPLATFLTQHPELAPQAAPVAASPAVGRIRAAAAPVAMRSSAAASEGGALLKTIGASLGVAIACGVAWAIEQCFLGIQLPYIIGVGIAWICGKTVATVSGGTTGALYQMVGAGSCTLAWAVGVFGVALGDREPRVGIWTIVCFLFALGMTWKTVNE
jgi:hypothetical protein